MPVPHLSMCPKWAEPCQREPSWGCPLESLTLPFGMASLQKKCFCQSYHPPFFCSTWKTCWNETGMKSTYNILLKCTCASSVSVISFWEHDLMTLSGLRGHLLDKAYPEQPLSHPLILALHSLAPPMAIPPPPACLPQLWYRRLSLCLCQPLQVAVDKGKKGSRLG